MAQVVFFAPHCFVMQAWESGEAEAVRSGRPALSNRSSVKGIIRGSGGIGGEKRGEAGQSGVLGGPLYLCNR